MARATDQQEGLERSVGDAPESDTFHGHLQPEIFFRVLASPVIYLLILIGLHLFLRGHNAPGGGFIAGLVVAAAALLSRMIRHRPLLVVSARRLVPLGLLVALVTGLVPLAFGRPFLTSAHGEAHGPLIGEFAWATGTLFDFGVFLVVVGTTLTIIDLLSEGPARHWQQVAAVSDTPSADASAAPHLPDAPVGVSAASRPEVAVDTSKELAPTDGRVDERSDDVGSEVTDAPSHELTEDSTDEVAHAVSAEPDAAQQQEPTSDPAAYPVADPAPDDQQQDASSLASNDDSSKDDDKDDETTDQEEVRDAEATSKRSALPVKPNKPNKEGER